MALKTAQERLDEAKELLHSLIVEKQSVVSSSAAGISLTKSISEVREYIKMLQDEVRLEQQDNGSFQWDVRVNI